MPEARETCRARRALLLCAVALALAPGACRCRGGASRQGTDRPPVVVVDPEEVGRPKPLPEREPNEAREQAQELPAGNSVEATLSGEHADVDWYAVPVTAERQVLAVTLGGIPGTDLALEGFDGQGERLVQVNNGQEGEGEVLVNLSAEPGKVYLKVRAVKGGGRYRIAYTLRAREEGEEVEPNWKETLATPLALDGEAVGYLGWHTDTDWYRVELAELAVGSRLRVEYDGVDEVRAGVSVRLPDGKIRQERWSRPGEGIVLANVALPDGTTHVFVVVRCQRSFNLEARYSLRAQAQVPAEPSEAEPNDGPGTANALAPGQTLAGILGDAGDRDFYAVRATAPTAVRVQVVPPLELDVALALVDGAGAVVREVDGGRAREPETLPVVWVQPPLAVLRLRPARRDDVAEVSPYRVRVEVLPEGAWEREPNDKEASATAWGAGPEVRGFVHPKGDVDFFSVVPRGEQLRLVAAGSARLRLALHLFEAGRSAPVARGQAEGEGVRLEARTRAGVTYLLRVTDLAGASDPGKEYSVKIEREEP